jgi:hypothetical protein
MECPICYTNKGTYVLECGSKIKHVICDICESTMRMKIKHKKEGRKLKCPMCRSEETKVGHRSALSYDYELSKSSSEERLCVYEERVKDRWSILAEKIRKMPKIMQEKYVRENPNLRPYL